MSEELRRDLALAKQYRGDGCVTVTQESLEALLDRVESLEKEVPRADAAFRTLTGMGLYWNGGAYFLKPEAPK